mmetsp:Transcript_8426/g.27201  ORF Transcript_8426/g.27201 Transcript_8426/m.27201 type:complete len:301 (-) Transcript_8426:139-1041(-)
MGCSSSRVEAPTETEEPLPVPRVYGSLIYNDASQGTLELHLTADSPAEGALAIFETRQVDKVPAWKLSRNQGRSELMKGVGGPSSTKFYEAWTHFVKASRSYPGTVTHVAQKEPKPVAIYALHMAAAEDSGRRVSPSAQPVRRVRLGMATDLSDAHFVAVVPAASLCFDGVQVLSAKMFSQNAKDAGGVVLDLLGDSQVGGSPAGGSDEKLQQRLAEQSDKVVTGESAIKDPVSRIASEYSAEKDPTLVKRLRQQSEKVETGESAIKMPEAAEAPPSPEAPDFEGGGGESQAEIAKKMFT